MKVLMLNEADGGGGAARAACRLHNGLGSCGVDSSLLVKSRFGNDPEVLKTSTPSSRIMRALRVHLDMLPVRLTPKRPLLNFSPAWLPDQVSRQVDKIDPDLIHLHWLAAGFLRLETLSKLNKPLVWTLHDSWAFTGGCHVPFDCTRYRQQCGACPVLGSTTENDLSRRVWERKMNAWKNLNLTIVAPSHWLAASASSSSLLHHARVEVIPNGLDLTIFKPVDKRHARKLLGLPQDKKLILAGGAGMQLQMNKGFSLLLAALKPLTSTKEHEQTELVLFGQTAAENRQSTGLKEHSLGWIEDEATLATAYSAADLFVLPSLLENLPNTVMESMACGTPCIAFAQGGMSQLIDHGINGYLASAYATEELTRGMTRLLVDSRLREKMSRQARLKMEQDFALPQVCQRYLSLYRQLLQ